MALPCTYGTPEQKERAREEEEVEKEIVCISFVLDRNLGRRRSTGRDLGSSVYGALARALCFSVPSLYNISVKADGEAMENVPIRNRRDLIAREREEKLRISCFAVSSCSLVAIVLYCDFFSC